MFEDKIAEMNAQTEAVAPAIAPYEKRVYGIVDFIWVDGHRHISRESFEKWYASQDKYKKIMEIEEVEDYVD